MEPRKFGEEIKKDNLSEKPPISASRRDKVELKAVRVGVETHDFLKKEAFRRDISIKNLLDEIIEDYKKTN